MSLVIPQNIVWSPRKREKEIVGTINVRRGIYVVFLGPLLYIDILVLDLARLVRQVYLVSILIVLWLIEN